MIRFAPVFVVTCICAIALAFGLIRIGVSVLLTLQTMGAFDIAAFREPVAEVQRFLEIENERALIPLSPIYYFTVIAMMGLCLVLGSVLSWRRKPLGYGALVLYLLMHAGLFMNFQTINPKIIYLITGIFLLIILVFSNRHRQSLKRVLSD